MSVSIIISDTSGGDPLASIVDLGSTTPTEETDHQDLFIRHTGSVAAITDCAFYMTQYSGSSYPGDDISRDYTEVLDWGDDYYSATTTSGGFFLNQEVPAGWVTGSAFDDDDWEVFRNGYGDIDHQIVLKKEAINIGTVTADGTIPVSGEAHVQIKWQCAASVPNGVGTRAISLVFAYSATS